MRERTTWNATQIKQAAMQRRADPYNMNQDHPQPKADAYVTGDPSSFAEDVQKTNTWDVEYANGETKRDEIGMPEKRPETYTHAEKTAGMDEATLLKKASLCSAVARMMLRGRKFASGDALEAAVEDQAVALMHMPNADLVATATRLADEDQAPQAQQQQAAQSQDQAPQAQTQQAQQQEQAPAPAQQQAQMNQQSMAQQVAQLMQQVAQLQQQAGCGQVQASAKRANQDQAPWAQQQQSAQQEQAPQAQQQQAQQQAPEQFPAQVQQAQQMPEQAPPQMQQQSDDMLLDEMLMGPDGGEMPLDMDSEMGIEMETPSMDVGEVVLAHEDEVLRTLFSTEETEQAEQAQQGQKQAGMARTASTRTVGTRPTGGVSRVGGVPAGRFGGDVDKLAALWPSAPDVRDAFNMK